MKDLIVKTHLYINQNNQHWWHQSKSIFFICDAEKVYNKNLQRQIFNNVNNVHYRLTFNNVLSIHDTEKLAEAQRRFATLQNELQSSLDAQRESSRATGLRRRRAVFHLSHQERSKHRNIKDLQLAFSEFYLSLILLQNYQVWKHMTFCNECQVQAQLCFSHYLNNAFQSFFYPVLSVECC